MHHPAMCLRLLSILPLLAAVGCQRAAPPEAPPPTTVQLDGKDYHLTGPYTHENLSVYLIHSKTQDDRDFITLDQGLKEGTVKVSEKAQAEVNQLVIENTSDVPLFLQEGDRLQGGQQDRILYASLVIPPKSGKMPIPTYCIEQSRWTGSVVFGVGENSALAPKATREAGKLGGDDKNAAQGQVWDSVSRTKKRAMSSDLTVSNTNSSLNETLESPQVKKLCDEFANALKGAVDEHSDSVGVAIVVNGTIEEVNIYPNHKLLGKLYPRLIQSYALQAALEKDKAKDATTPSCEDIAKFMSEGKEKSKRTEDLDGRNRLRVVNQEGKALCVTEYQGGEVHRQFFNQPNAGQPANQPVGQPQPQAPAPNRSPER